MNKEFVNYDIALELKELGFDEPCFGYYNYNGSHFFKYKPKTDDKNLTKAPLYQQAFRWFREEYNFDSYIRPNIVIDIPKTYQFNINDNTDDTWYETYLEAELACLIKLIEIVKNK